MAASIKIGRIFGVPIYLHLTFLIILPLFIYVFSDPPNQVTILGLALSFKELDASQTVKYAFGTIAAIIFFVTVLLHELAHSYLALKYGVKIKGITLMVFGGVSQMEEMPRLPRQEWRMAFAGPMTSLVTGLASWLGWFLLDATDPSSVAVQGITILLGIMALYNVLLAGFNLIPAFPMDGGRVLRAYFALRMNFLEATRKAARVGRYFALGMAIYGIFTFNFFLIIIALFVYIGATEEEQATTISESLSGVKVGRVMSTQVRTVHPDMSVQELHDLILTTRFMGFPVVENDALVGIVTLSDTHKVPRDGTGTARVRDIMTKKVMTATPDMDAAKALFMMSELKIGRLVVLENGKLAGIVTQKDLLRTVDMILARRQTLWGAPRQAAPQPQAPPPPPTF
jgi:Zn-dependent protease